MVLPMLTVTPPSVSGKLEGSVAEAVVFARCGPKIEIIDPGARVAFSKNDAALTTRML